MLTGSEPGRDSGEARIEPQRCDPVRPTLSPLISSPPCPSPPDLPSWLKSTWKGLVTPPDAQRPSLPTPMQSPPDRASEPAPGGDESGKGSPTPCFSKHVKEGRFICRGNVVTSPRAAQSQRAVRRRERADRARPEEESQAGDRPGCAAAKGTACGGRTEMGGLTVVPKHRTRTRARSAEKS